MPFTDAYANVLHPFIDDYKRGQNIKEKRKAVNDAADAVSKSQNLLEDEGLDLPKDLKTVGFFIFYPSPVFLINLGHNSIF